MLHKNRSYLTWSKKDSISGMYFQTFILNKKFKFWIYYKHIKSAHQSNSKSLIKIKPGVLKSLNKKEIQWIKFSCFEGKNAISYEKKESLMISKIRCHIFDLILVNRMTFRCFMLYNETCGLTKNDIL